MYTTVMVYHLPYGIVSHIHTHTYILYIVLYCHHIKYINIRLRLLDSCNHEVDSYLPFRLNQTCPDLHILYK